RSAPSPKSSSRARAGNSASCEEARASTATASPFLWTRRPPARTRRSPSQSPNSRRTAARAATSPGRKRAASTPYGITVVAARAPHQPRAGRRRRRQRERRRGQRRGLHPHVARQRGGVTPHLQGAQARRVAEGMEPHPPLAGAPSQTRVGGQRNVDLVAQRGQ